MTLPTASKSGVEATGTATGLGASATSNIFRNFPPIIPMVVIAVALVTMAQFGSTERLAAAFAWLIFFAVLFADGIGAFDNLSRLMGGTTTTSTGGTFNTGNPPTGTNPNIR